MTFKKNLCSVCCLGYKQKNFIKDCFESILNQEYENFEIVALDDGSDDGSDKILEEYEKKYPDKIRILKQKHTGNVGYNMNQLIKAARGEFITTAAFDDMLTKDSISSKIYKMIEEPDIMISINSKVIHLYDNTEQIVEYPIEHIQNPTAKDLFELEYNNFHSYFVQGSVIRKKLIENVGYFSENMLGDDIIIRTKIALFLQNNPQYKFLIYNTPSFYYRIHDSNMHKNPYTTISIVAQWLQVYCPDRENPPILFDWFFPTISNEKSLIKILRCFKFPRLRYYLKDKRVQKIIIKKIISKTFSISNQIKNNKKIKYLTILGKDFPIYKKELNNAI